MFKTVSRGGPIDKGTTFRYFVDGLLISEQHEGLGLYHDGTRVTEFQQSGWRRRIQDGENATTLLSGVERTVKSSPCFVYRKVEGFGGTTFETMLTENYFRMDMPDLPDPMILIAASNQAITRFLSNLQAARSEFQSGIFLGELAEALRMIKNPVSSFRKGLGDYIRVARGYRMRRGSVRSRNRSISRSWLEYNYGWAPLLSDAKSAAEAAAALVEYSSPWRYVTHEPGLEVIPLASVPAQTLSYPYLLPSLFMIETSHEATVQFRGVVDIQMDSTGAGRRALPTLGLTLRDFVPTIWELIPFSFVVDYFTNVGDILEALSYGVSDVRWYSKTSRTASVRTATGFIPSPYFPGPDDHLVTEHLDPGSMSLSSKTVLRQTLYGPLLPDFQVRIPGFTSRKWLNLAALARALT